MRIHVIAPSRRLDPEAARRVEEIAADYPDFSMTFDAQCFLQSGHFAGTDEERARAFVAAANDPSINVLWFARGGYGSCRILDAVVGELSPQAQNKTYIGYSDTGYFLSALAARGVGQPVHGPMVTDVMREGGQATVRRVLDFLGGDKHALEPSLKDVPAAAFNTSILASLVAGPHLPNLKGRVVAIEEIDEHLYAFDRALYTIFSSGQLSEAQGVRLGRVSGTPQNDIPFGETSEEILKKWCKQYGTPYLGPADIGHDTDNKLVCF